MTSDLIRIILEAFRIASDMINGSDSNEIIELIQKAQQEQVWQADDSVKAPSMKEFLYEKKSDGKPEWELSSTTDFFSAYVSRGMVFADNPVLQQIFKAKYGNFTLTNFNSFGEKPGSKELDFIIEYKKNLGKVSFSTGFGFFKLIDQSVPDTQEIYLKVGFDVPLNPNFKIIQDIDEAKGRGGNGRFIMASVSKNFKIKDLNFSTSAELGFNDGYFRKESGLSHLLFKLGVPIDLGNGWSMTPNINYNHNLDSFENKVYGGLSFGWSNSK